MVALTLLGILSAWCFYSHLSPHRLWRTNENEGKKGGGTLRMGHLGGDWIGLNGLAERLENLGIETVRVGILPENK